MSGELLIHCFENQIYINIYKTLKLEPLIAIDVVELSVCQVLCTNTQQPSDGYHNTLRKLTQQQWLCYQTPAGSC